MLLIQMAVRFPADGNSICVHLRRQPSSHYMSLPLGNRDVQFEIFGK